MMCIIAAAVFLLVLALLLYTHLTERRYRLTPQQFLNALGISNESDRRQNHE